MTLNREDKIALSEARMAKAREFLSDAIANLESQRYRTSVNRAYYTALSAVRSVLIIEGASPETHDGVITILGLRFIKTALLSGEVSKKLKGLYSRRADVDYGDFDAITQSEAEDSVRDAEMIIDAVDEVRTRLIQEL
jgi:uncharacterized protein (UPF0332 family)